MLTLKPSATLRLPKSDRVLPGLSLIAILLSPACSVSPAVTKLASDDTNSCSVWAAGTNYNEGAKVSFNGAGYVAIHANPGYDPSLSTWYWGTTSCGGSSQSQSQSQAPANASGGSCSAWAAGTDYAEGAHVSFNGKGYVASHANPGYDPSVSTWYWAEASCDAGNSTSQPSTQDNNQRVASAPLADDLMAKSSSRTKTDKTPMGRWFENAVDVSISDDDKRFLEDANQNVPIPDDHGGDWSYHKFTVNLFPTNGKPHPADGRQGGLGDCNMLSLLNSFAYQHPDFLKGIINDRGNGNYDISMFNPKAEPIIVSVNSDFIANRDGNLIVSNGNGNSAIWLTVMEKAIMKYNHIYKIWAGDGPGKVEGFGSEAGAPMLTGEGDSYAFDRGALANSHDLTRVVRDALAAGKIITGGFGQEMNLNGLKSVTGHAYTVLVPQDNNTMISMRNPWGFSPKADGGGDDSHDGILDIGYLDDWFRTIDIRVMEPGIAGGRGNTDAYRPRNAFQLRGFSVDDMQSTLKAYYSSN